MSTFNFQSQSLILIIFGAIPAQLESNFYFYIQIYVNFYASETNFEII